MVATAERVGGTEREEDLGERLLGAARGTFDLFAVYLGDRLGLYDALVAIEPATSGELAERTGTSERYVREWLEQQTVAGILAVENLEAGPLARRFCLPEGHAEVLSDRDSPSFLAPLAQIAVGTVSPVAAVAEAFRSGGGVPYEEYGVDLRQGQAGMNRHLFLRQLGTEYLPAIPDLHARLLADPPARVADIGCGLGWSSIGIARAYPTAIVDGFDLDEASVAEAELLVREYGLTERVEIKVRDVADPSLSGRYDLVTAFECVHDLSDPVDALRTMRRLAGADGTVLVMDERVGERFDPAAGDVERLLYGFSLLHCLPVGLADQPSAATGTVMRPATLRGYAREAGFRDVEILPLEHEFFRFYRLVA